MEVKLDPSRHPAFHEVADGFPNVLKPWSGGSLVYSICRIFCQGFFYGRFNRMTIIRPSGEAIGSNVICEASTCHS